MEGNLFNKVNKEKLDLLHEALSEVIKDMLAKESVDTCWKSHTNLTHPGKYFRPSKVKIMRPTSPK